MLYPQSTFGKVTLTDGLSGIVQSKGRKIHISGLGTYPDIEDGCQAKVELKSKLCNCGNNQFSIKSVERVYF